MVRTRLSTDQVHEVLGYAAPGRFASFLSVVADTDEVWGLFKDGWAETDTVLPLWPFEEFAEACATGPWEGYHPECIELDTLLDEVLPWLDEHAQQPAVFPTPSGAAIVVSTEELREAILEALEESPGVH